MKNGIETGLLMLSGASLAVAIAAGASSEANAKIYKDLMQSDSYLHGETLLHASQDLAIADQDLTYKPSIKAPLGITMVEAVCPDIELAKSNMDLAIHKVESRDPQFAQDITKIEESIPIIPVPLVNCSNQNGQIYEVYSASRVKLNVLRSELEEASNGYTAELHSHDGSTMPAINLTLGGFACAAVFGLMAMDERNKRKTLRTTKKI